jgi:quercetin dioxygenase-like cupin family protein
MSGYTVVNLKEVEDQAPRFGYAPDLESRFARRALELENSGLSYFRAAPGFRMPFGHRHSEQEEVYVVVAGSARIKLGDDIVELGPWDAIRVPAHLTRALEGGPRAPRSPPSAPPATRTPTCRWSRASGRTTRRR